MKLSTEVGERVSGSAVFNDRLLAGKVCVVSGGGTGIGRAIAEEFGRLGAEVVVCGRRVEVVDEAADAIRQAGGRAHALPLDIRDEPQVAAFVDTVVQRHGRIDVLVNNAGGQFYAPAERISPKGFRSVMELNLYGTYLMTHTVATGAFIPKGRGRVISITTSPHNGLIGAAHSGAARAGVENLTKSLSLEWGRFGITLCAIAISSVQTEIWSKYPAEAIESLAGEVSVGRVGRPDEVAWLAAYLAADVSGFITGTVINFDGGRDNGLPVARELETERRQ